MLKKYTKDPACVPPLLQQMQSSQHEQARQFASMLIKKNIVRHWKTFNDQEKASVREERTGNRVALPYQVYNGSK